MKGRKTYIMYILYDITKYESYVMCIYCVCMYMYIYRYVYVIIVIIHIGLLWFLHSNKN